MFLSCDLFITLIDVPCKSGYCIVRLKPIVRACHSDGDDYASSRNRGQRGRDDEKEWDGSKGVKGAEKRWTLWGETCSARRSSVVEGDRCREGLLLTEWASDREFNSLEQR
jgi:hypothetical protein